MAYIFFTSLKPLDNHHGFTRSTLDMRFYIPLHSDQTIAIQGKAILTTGDVPFRMLSTIGNDLRGYSTVRHIDRHLIAIQAEYRVVPVAWRIGLPLAILLLIVFKYLGNTIIMKQFASIYKHPAINRN